VLVSLQLLRFRSVSFILKPLQQSFSSIFYQHFNCVPENTDASVYVARFVHARFVVCLS